MRFASRDNLIDLMPLLAAKVGSGIKKWTASTYYIVDDIVFYDNSLYRCTTAHTSTSTFDPSKWQELGGGGGASFTEWTANTSYNVDDIIYHEGQLYKVVTAFTSGTTFDDDNLEFYLPKGLSSQTIQDLIDNFNPGGGINVIVDTLWEGKAYTTNQTYPLSNDYTNYDYLIIHLGNTNIIDNTFFLDPKKYNVVTTSVRLGGVDYSVVFTFSGASFTVNVIANMNETTVHITRIDGIKFLNSNVYSTEEKRIGAWVDGSPIYQKTIIATNVVCSAGDGATKIGTIGSFSNIIGFEGVQSTDGLQYVPLDGCWTGASGTTPLTGANSWHGWLIVESNGDVMLGQSLSMTVAKCYVTVKYTKTTD